MTQNDVRCKYCRLQHLRTFEMCYLQNSKPIIYEKQPCNRWCFEKQLLPPWRWVRVRQKSEEMMSLAITISSKTFFVQSSCNRNSFIKFLLTSNETQNSIKLEKWVSTIINNTSMMKSTPCWRRASPFMNFQETTPMVVRWSFRQGWKMDFQRWTTAMMLILKILLWVLWEKNNHSIAMQYHLRILGSWRRWKSATAVTMDSDVRKPGRYCHEVALPWTGPPVHYTFSMIVSWLYNACC